MPRATPWVPGHRASQPKRKRNPLPMKRIMSADLERVNVRASTFNYPDDEVVRTTNLGLTPEVNEPNLLLGIQRDDTIININLTGLTEEELDALKEALNFAIEEARPTVQERDKVAKEAYANGDGTYKRLHRGTPKVSYVKRQESADDEGVRD